MEDINQFIYKGNGCSDSKYVVFVDFGMYDLDNLSEKKFNNIDGIRFGFTKKDFYTEREEIEKQIKESAIKKKERKKKLISIIY